MKKLALGAVALGFEDTHVAFRQALPLESDHMDDAQVRAAFVEGKLHVKSSLDALRRQGRDALADELEAQYAPPPPPVEESEESEDSAEDENVESSGSDSSGDEEESESSPVGEDSSSDSDGGIAMATGGGWFELDPPFEGADKVQGKKNVPDGYAIIED